MEFECSRFCFLFSLCRHLTQFKFVVCASFVLRFSDRWTINQVRRKRRKGNKTKAKNEEQQAAQGKRRRKAEQTNGEQRRTTMRFIQQPATAGDNRRSAFQSTRSNSTLKSIRCRQKRCADAQKFNVLLLLLLSIEKKIFCFLRGAGICSADRFPGDGRLTYNRLQLGTSVLLPRLAQTARTLG